VTGKKVLTGTQMAIWANQLPFRLYTVRNFKRGERGVGGFETSGRRRHPDLLRGSRVMRGVGSGGKGNRRKEQQQSCREGEGKRQAGHTGSRGLHESPSRDDSTGD